MLVVVCREYRYKPLGDLTDGLCSNVVITICHATCNVMRICCYVSKSVGDKWLAVRMRVCVCVRHMYAKLYISYGNHTENSIEPANCSGNYITHNNCLQQGSKRQMSWNFAPFFSPSTMTRRKFAPNIK